MILNYRKPLFALIVIVLAFSFFSTSVIFASEEKDVIKVGGPLALTGPYAGDGITCKRALEMAVDDINSSGGLLGKKLKLILYDVDASLLN